MSPRTAKQNKEIRQERRKEILDAALELFATQGYHNTSISQIAKKAEVSKGLIYNYIEKKEDLMYEIVYSRFSEGDDFMKQIGEQPDAKSRLRLIFDMSFDYLMSNPHQSKLMASLSLQLDQFPDLTELVKARYAGMLPLVEALFQEIEVPYPREEAITITAMLDGLGLQYLVMGDAMDLTEIKQYLIHKYCT